MKKQLQLFLTDNEEVFLSSCLKSVIPEIRFLNGNVWNVAPEVREGITECTSGVVYLYNKPIEHLPTRYRRNGMLEGPAGGCVVLLLRCKLAEGVLISGCVAAGIDDNDSEMRAFVNRIWKCVRKMGRIGVKTVEGQVDRHYLVGDCARNGYFAGSFQLADRASRVLVEPL